MCSWCINQNNLNFLIAYKYILLIIIAMIKMQLCFVLAYLSEMILLIGNGYSLDLYTYGVICLALYMWFEHGNYGQEVLNLKNLLHPIFSTYIYIRCIQGLSSLVWILNSMHVASEYPFCLGKGLYWIRISTAQLQSHIF